MDLSLMVAPAVKMIWQMFFSFILPIGIILIIFNFILFKIKRRKSHKKYSSSREYSNTISCPKCGNEMVVRKNNMGKKFWGCIRFPQCRGKRSFIYYRNNL